MKSIFMFMTRQYWKPTLGCQYVQIVPPSEIGREILVLAVWRVYQNSQIFAEMLKMSTFAWEGLKQVVQPPAPWQRGQAVCVSFEKYWISKNIEKQFSWVNTREFFVKSNIFKLSDGIFLHFSLWKRKLLPICHFWRCFDFPPKLDVRNRDGSKLEPNSQFPTISTLISFTTFTILALARFHNF